MDELSETFREFDLDGDGRITEQEFARAMAARGEEIPAEELASIFRDADEDRDGSISLPEFTSAWHRAG